MKARAQLFVCACALAGSGAFGAGCLDAGETEPAGYSPKLRSEGAKIPAVESDDRLRKRIDSKDNVEGMMVLLHTGYTDGQPLSYYDFGVIDAMSSPKPQWQFRRRGKDGEPEDFGHLDLVDSAPGDTGYSPLRMLYQVRVTRAYDGERITSLEALEDALEIGLVEEPVPLGSYAACPIVLADTALEASEGAPAPLEARQVYYRGHVATCYLATGEGGDGVLALDEMRQVPVGAAYALRRQNETRALDEALWKADFNADGDQRDSNLVFGSGATSRVSWRINDVTVPPTYMFGDSGAESDLFQRGMLGLQALEGKVIAYADSGTRRLLVAWSEVP